MHSDNMGFKVAFFEVLNTLARIENFEKELANLLTSELRLNVSSEELANKIKNEWINKYNQLISRGAYRSIRQLAREVISSVIRHYTVSVSPQELEYFSNAASSLIVEQAILYEDVPETLQKLAEHNIDMYILTNLDNDIAKKILLKYNILRYFKGVISSDLSRAGKPSAKIFQAALLRAKTSKDNAVVVSGLIEDVVGSKLVGLKVIYVAREGKRPDIAVDYVVNKLPEIVQIIVG